MSKGLRFFGTNFADLVFGGTITASSADNTKEFAFDGLSGTRWISDGEGTDGNAVSLEMDFGFNRTIDCLYVSNTNIEDIVLAYWNGASYTNITVSNATIITDASGQYVFVKLNASVDTQKIKLTGSNTITANQEKYVTQFMAFAEIGQFEYFPDFEPEIEPKQNVFETTDGRAVVIERGEAFAARITFRSHVNQNDIDLAEELYARKEPFFIWPHGGDESGIFRFSFRPFRFQDIIKVTIVGKRSPKFSKGYYRAGFNDSMNLIEAV